MVMSGAAAMTGATEAAGRVDACACSVASSVGSTPWVLAGGLIGSAVPPAMRSATSAAARTIRPMARSSEDAPSPACQICGQSTSGTGRSGCCCAAAARASDSRSSTNARHRSHESSVRSSAEPMGESEGVITGTACSLGVDQAPDGESQVESAETYQVELGSGTEVASCTLDEGSGVPLGVENGNCEPLFRTHRGGPQARSPGDTNKTSACCPRVALLLPRVHPSRRSPERASSAPGSPLLLKPPQSESRGRILSWLTFRLRSRGISCPM